jgi:ubiquinone/menaquinone biosynthesis C-methylase UbiE
VEEAEYHKMFAYEDAHWWFRGKRAVVAGLLERFADVRSSPMSLDVGCGTGANLAMLAGYGPSYGVDSHPVALALCRRRGCTAVVRGEAQRLPYRDARFDIVTLLDVLYHREVRDVGASLREAWRVCKPGGVVLITDAAFELLRGAHDVAYHGARRFRRGELVRAVETAGFQVVKASYGNALLFPALAVVRLVDRVRHRDAAGRSSLGPPPPVANRLLELIYRVEARLLRYVSWPFGLSVIVVGRKS